MNNTEAKKSEAVKQSAAPPKNALKDKKSESTAKRLETIVAILLGITTLLSAWATWISSLHGGIQSINFTKSNHASSEGTAEYNMSMQLYLSDYMTWNTIKEYNYDLELAKSDGDKEKIKLINNKIKAFKESNVAGILSEAIKWMEDNNQDNPFSMPGITQKYFDAAEKKINKSQELLEEGMLDNKKGDSYHLVTVIYSLTLFLLGIIGTFKNMPNRITVLLIAIAALVFAAVYMFTIPLPTGFEISSFFEFK